MGMTRIDFHGSSSKSSKHGFEMLSAFSVKNDRWLEGFALGTKNKSGDGRYSDDVFYTVEESPGSNEIIDLLGMEDDDE